MLQIVHQNKGNRHLESHGLRFLVLSSLVDYDVALLADADAVVMAELDPFDAQQVINEIRRARDKQTYLKPIFGLHGEARPQTGSFDGFTDLTEMESIVHLTRRIMGRIEEVNTIVVPHDFERHVLFKQLAYLHTRDCVLDPEASRSSKIGYAFPFIENLVSDGASLELLNILDLGIEKGLLTAKVKDRIHTCNSCHGNYINFREVCPKCQTVDIESKDLVHHFKCAHVDVIDKFKEGEELVCPKCDNKLRHIGIDYDKPSTMHECRCCHHQFQESDMIAFCIDCGKEEDTSNLLENEICTYALTERGEHIVKNGWDEKAVEGKETVKHLPFELFKMMLNLEVQRAKNETKSVLAKYVVSHDIVAMLGAEGREQFQKEILSIVGSYVEETDLLTTKNAEEYFVLFHDVSLSDVQDRCELIEHNLTKLIGDNLNPIQNLIVGTTNPIVSDLNLENIL